MIINNGSFFMNNVYDIIHDNTKNIHNKLFNDAIDRYCSENNKNKNEYKIIDQENKEDILKPSKAIFIKDNIMSTIDLSDYWNINYNNLNNKNNIFKELLINNEDKKNIDIEYIDYVNGKVLFRNKFNNKKFFVKFNKLNKKIQNNLTNTFTSLYYG